MRFPWMLAGLLCTPAAFAADLSRIETVLSEVAIRDLEMAPDGSRLAFVMRRNDLASDRQRYTLGRIDLTADGHAGQPVVVAEVDSCQSLRWSPDGRWLSYLTDTAETGNQLVVVAALGGAPRLLSDASHFPEGIDVYGWLPDGSGVVVEAADPPSPQAVAADRRLHDLYGDVRRLPSRPFPRSLARIALRDGGVERFRPSPFVEPLALAVSPDGQWVAVAGDDAETIAGTATLILPLGPAAEVPPQGDPDRVFVDRLFWGGRDLFVLGLGENNGGRYSVTESRIHRLDPATLHLVRVAPALPGSVTEAVPVADGSLLAVTEVSTRMQVSWVDPRSGRVKLLRDQHGWIANLTASAKGDRIAFAAGDADHFGEIYVAPGPAGLAQAVRVTDVNGALASGPLPEIETVSWPGADGDRVEGVLFWPPGRRGQEHLPLIVDLHGGPFGVARVESIGLWGDHMSYPVLLAARGFLVLNPNYRGSGGRGDAFTQGVEGHRCSRASADVVAGVEHLVARGWADRQRVGVIGYSGGGGISKCLIGRTDVFHAVATGAGDWDDIALFGTPRGSFWSEVYYEGKPLWEDAQRWWEESPVAALAAARTPTLIVAGERDGTSPGQAAELYHDLVWRGTPAELLIFPGERHLFTRPSHLQAKIRAEVSWFEHYLLGKPRE